MTHEDSLRNAFDHCIKEFGQVPDVVYANAGVALDDHFEDDYEIGELAISLNRRPSAWEQC